MLFTVLPSSAKSQLFLLLLSILFFSKQQPKLSGKHSLLETNWISKWKCQFLRTSATALK